MRPTTFALGRMTLPLTRVVETGFFPCGLQPPVEKIKQTCECFRPVRPSGPTAGSEPSTGWRIQDDPRPVLPPTACASPRKRFSRWTCCRSFRDPGSHRGQGGQAAPGCRPVNGNSALHDNRGSNGGVKLQGPYRATVHDYQGRANKNRTLLKPAHRKHGADFPV